MFKWLSRSTQYIRRRDRRASLQERISTMARDSQVDGFTDADAFRIAERVAYYAQQHRSVEQTISSPQRERVLAAIAAEESQGADGLYRDLILRRGGAAAIERLEVETRPRPSSDG